jgi:hypothetical protein
MGNGITDPRRKKIEKNSANRVTLNLRLEFVSARFFSYNFQSDRIIILESGEFDKSGNLSPIRGKEKKRNFSRSFCQSSISFDSS